MRVFLTQSSMVWELFVDFLLVARFLLSFPREAEGDAAGAGRRSSAQTRSGPADLLVLYKVLPGPAPRSLTELGSRTGPAQKANVAPWRAVYWRRSPPRRANSPLLPQLHGDVLVNIIKQFMIYFNLVKTNKEKRFCFIILNCFILCCKNVNTLEKLKMLLVLRVKPFPTDQNITCR